MMMYSNFKNLFDAYLFIHKVRRVVIGRLIDPIVPTISKFKWNILLNNNNFCGTTKAKRNTEIIISLTSFPARINVVSKTIKTLLMQTMKPDRVVLWLAEEQFPYKEADLPLDLIDLTKFGLEIRWTNDIRSYKKLVPALELFKDAIIITTDDDLYYSSNLVRSLYRTHVKHPKDIICHRASKIIESNGKYALIPGGYDYYNGASFLNKLVGCSGVLYPVNSLHSLVTKEQLFMNLAPTNDDIWFWFMGILNNTKVRVVKNNNPFEHSVEGTQKGEQLSAVNDRGEKLFWKQFFALLRRFPEIKTKMES